MRSRYNVLAHWRAYVREISLGDGMELTTLFSTNDLDNPEMKTIVITRDVGGEERDAHTRTHTRKRNKYMRSYI